MEIIRLQQSDNEIFEQMVDWNYSWWGIREGKSREEIAYSYKHLTKNHRSNDCINLK